MYGEEMEKAFEKLIMRSVYDKAESVLFEIVRVAFIAGWEAAEKSNAQLHSEDQQAPEEV